MPEVQPVLGERHTGFGPVEVRQQVASEPELHKDSARGQYQQVALEPELHKDLVKGHWRATPTVLRLGHRMGWEMPVEALGGRLPEALLQVPVLQILRTDRLLQQVRAVAAEEQGFGHTCRQLVVAGEEPGADRTYLQEPGVVHTHP